MSKKHHHQGQVGNTEAPTTSPTTISVEEAQKEEQVKIEAELEEIAEEVEAKVEAKENPSGFKARMKALKEQQKAEMLELKEELKAEKEKAKAEGQIVSGPATSIGRRVITGRVVSQLDGPKKFDELAIICDEAYVASNPDGHKSNIREARTVLRDCLGIAPILTGGAIKVEGDLISRTVSA